MSDPQAMTVTRIAARAFQVAVSLELIGLAVQFLLGMYLNLYIDKPRSQPVLVVHIAVGFVLLAAAAVSLGAAVLLRDLARIAVSLVGIGALTLAVNGGLHFLNHGQHNLDSYLMALGFVTAVSAFAGGAMVNERRRGLRLQHGVDHRSAGNPARQPSPRA